MAEEKPMTVKERMAALALASSGGNSAAPTPAPQKSSGASMGTSVAERLAKMRAGPGGAGSSPAGSSAPAKKPGLVRTFTPPSSAPKVDTQSPGGGRGRPMSGGGGGSSIADKIAALSGGGGGSSSILPPSPSVGPMGSSTPPALKPENSSSGVKQQTSAPPQDSSALPPAREDTGKARESPRVSSGLAARMEAMKMNSSDSAPFTGAGGEKEDTVATTGGATSNLAGRISPGLAARMNAINSSSDAHGGRGGKTDDNADVGDTPPPPPVLAPSGSSSSSASKMSPGLAARMGKAIPIPMPGGAMPMGGLAELKRRKQEKEYAEKAAGGEPDAHEASESTVEKKPGELQHANLSRPIISQRRRPRKSARPFKASATVAAVVPPIEAETSTEPARTTSPIEAASPPPSSETEAVAETEASAPREEEAGKEPSAGGAKEEGEDPADKMNSMLRAASVGGDGDNGDDDDEWDE